MANIKIQPWHLIVIGIAIFMIFQSGAVPFLGAVTDLIDPSTELPFVCEVTLDCYNQIGITGVGAAPALECSNSQCSFAECVDSDTERISCPGGTTITVRECVDGQWQSLSPTCPPTECRTSEDCIFEADSTCNGDLNAVRSICSADFTCTTPELSKCSNAQLFWGKYRWWIISGVLVAIGLGGFIYAAPRKLKFFG